MNPDDFSAAFAYIRWADLRQVEAAGTVKDPAEYMKNRNISHGSVHAVLHHMMVAQAGWLGTWKGSSQGIPDTSAGACADFASIQRTWPAVHEAFNGYLRSLRPADLERPITFNRRAKEVTLTLGQTILHVLDHATYHRGQLNSLIKLAGGTPVWCSYWIYALTLDPGKNSVTDGDFR